MGTSWKTPLLLLLLVTSAAASDKTPFEDKFGAGIGSDCLRDLYDAVYNDEDDGAAFAREVGSILARHPGCDVNEVIPDKSGQTLLMHCVLRGKPARIVAALLDNGADVSIGEQMGYTPIHGSGFQGRADAARVLLEHPKSKMDVGDRHKDGFTPLHRACWGNDQRHADTARVLLEHGADADDPMCHKKPDGTENCAHPIEGTKFGPTVEVLREFTKLDKYKTAKSGGADDESREL